MSKTCKEGTSFYFLFVDAPPKVQNPYCFTYVNLAKNIANDELAGWGGVRGEGGGGGECSPEKSCMQYTDLESQQRSPLVAFPATTLLVKQ